MEEPYHSDDDSSSDNDDCHEEVQLGFPEDRKNMLFHEVDWTKWDGGKVGGFPVNFALNFLLQR